MTKFVKIEGLSDSLDRRFFSDHELQPDPALVAEGWERRFTADTQRAEEAAELYSQLGYEVRMEPLNAGEFHDDCEDCHSSMASKFKTVYTRKKKS